jgi:outer membrane receptor protein involved in Fe transport
MISIRNAVTNALRAAALEKQKHRSAALTAMALALGISGVAFSQQSGDTNQTLDEVTVTGSRIRRTTDFDTANPTTVVDAEYLKNLGITNVGDVVKQLPSNVSNNTPATTGNANFFAGSTIANLRGLNPFFGSRTLTLVNSRRFVPTNQGDGVDLNFIPSVLIDRVDIVTGGASAAYGSGAVSGVQNIFLNRKLDGGKLEMDFGQTAQSDGKDKHVGAAYGMALGDRAHFTIGGEWQDSDPIGCYNARDWCREGRGQFANTPGAVPANLVGTNLRANQMTTAGVFYTAGAGATTPGVNAAGTGLNAFNLGTQPYAGASPTAAVPGGDGRSAYQYTNLRAPVNRKVATGTFTFDINDSTHMNVDLSWGNVETLNITGALDAQNLNILGSNAYVQGTGLTAAFNGAGSRRALNKDWTQQLDSYSRFTTRVKRGAVGFDGSFGQSSWGWDAYYQYGETDREQYVNDNRHLNAYLMATDAVVNAQGQTVCRVTRDGFAGALTSYKAAQTVFAPGQTVVNAPYFLADPRIAQGCVPLNPFGTGAVSQTAHDYAFGFLRENLNYKQQVAALNTSGDLFKNGVGLGAGPIQAALGVEYRVEEGKNIAAEEVPSYIRTDYLIQYGESFSGNVNVTEAYGELSIPILQDRSFAKHLSFDLAARESHYKNEGKEGTTGETRTHDLFTWKVQAIWDPTDWLRLRGTQSRDARAANFRELYYGQKIKAGGTFGYCGPTGTAQRDPCDWSLEGNVDLNPEKSDTTTMGFVITPKDLLPGFQFAADYFRINIDSAIQQANTRRVLDGCQISHIAEFCALLVPDRAGNFNFTQGAGTADTDLGINSIRATAFNGSGYTYKGVDFSSSYLWEVTDASNITFRLLATKMINQLYQPVPGQPFRQLVGQTGTANSFLSDNQPAARWQSTLAATFNHGPLSLTGQMRYVSDGTYNYLGVVCDPGPAGSPQAVACAATIPAGGTSYIQNSVPSYTIANLSGSYNFENLFGTKTFQVFGAISNLFDKNPPLALGGNSNGGTNAVFFDTAGRSYRLGLRVAF